MRPLPWNPPIELSSSEQQVAKKIRKAKLFLLLREIRHELFDAQFQEELATIFKDSTVGKCPVPPAQLALAIILQAYTGVSDDELIEALIMDRRWQLVLDCLDCEQAPFGKGTLVRFRGALIASEGDRRLVERTIEMVEQKGGFSSRTLKAALDSSPLWGAARVEDTYNLLGHALRKALELIARQQQLEYEDVASQSGASLLVGPSLKAALDRDWDEPEARTEALKTILQLLDKVESWVEEQDNLDDPTMIVVNKSLEAARQVEAQDVEVTESGDPKLRKGVAKDRRIAIEDEQMRHGRKSRSKKFDGYKRHILKDLDSGLVRAVGVTPANIPESSVTEEIASDLEAQQVTLEELHIDRGYLNSHFVKERDDNLTIICKAWRVRNGDFFDKTAFVIDWEKQSIRCPNGVDVTFQEGKKVQFPREKCEICPLRSQCTTNSKGRTVSIHPDESLLQELRERQKTPSGRSKLRERVTVEHSLAHIGQWQGDRARYLGVRKNLFDLRRMAVVHNLHLLARMPTTTQEKTA